MKDEKEEEEASQCGDVEPRDLLLSRWSHVMESRYGVKLWSHMRERLIAVASWAKGSLTGITLVQGNHTMAHGRQNTAR